MNGDPTDNNAKLFAEGYTACCSPYFDDGTYTKVGEPPGTWDPATAATTFEQQWTAHPEINAVVMPNDDNANAVIAVLKKNKIPANTFPTTGQDASPVGLQNILTGYQCGTVYKPIYLEAQAAAALAIFLRAGVTPPSTLVNDTTHDDELNADIPSVYTVPIWVTTDMVDTVVRTETTGIGRRPRPLRRRGCERLHGRRHKLAADRRWPDHDPWSGQPSDERRWGGGRTAHGRCGWRRTGRVEPLREPLLASRHQQELRRGPGR